MIFTIKEVKTAVTTGGNEYLKVSGFSPNDNELKTKNIFDNLKEKWPLIKENETLDLKMEKDGRYWNVIDINPIEVPDLAREAVKEGAVVTEIKESKKSGSKYKADPDKTFSIEKQVALKEATNLCVGGKIEKGEIGTWMRAFVKLLKEIE